MSIDAADQEASEISRICKYLENDKNYALDHKSSLKCKKCETDKYISCKNWCPLPIKPTTLIDPRLMQLWNSNTINDFQFKFFSMYSWETNAAETWPKPISVEEKTFDENRRGRIHALAIQADVDEMLKLFKKGADPTLKTRAGLPPMYFAICSGCPHIVQLLIDWYSDANEKIPCLELKRYIPILHYAVHLNKPAIVQQLLHYRADVNLCDSLKYTALHLATEKGYVEILKILLAHRARVDDVTKRGDTPLMLAIRYNFDEVIRILLNNGVYINKRDLVTGESIIHVAVAEDDIHTLSTILRYEADINLKREDECTPLQLAVLAICDHENNRKCCNNQKLESINENVIENCPNFRKINTAIVLLNHGADVNLKNSKGQIVLHAAIKNKSCKHFIQVLLQNRADINASDKNKLTPLCFAIEKMYKDKKKIECHSCHESYLENKKDIESHLSIEILITLLRHADNVNVINEFGIMPLRTAIEKNFCEHLIQILLDKGADVNMQNKKKYSPLLYAVEEFFENNKNRKCWNIQKTQSKNKQVIQSCPNKKKIDLVTKLIKHGANVNLKCVKNQTVMHVTMKKNGCKHLSQILLDAGADLNQKDQYDYSPLSYKIEKVCENIINEQCWKIQRTQLTNSEVIEFCPNKKQINAVIDLLKYGANVNSECGSYTTGLYQSIARDGCKHLIQMLLDNGADPNEKTKYGDFPLACAVRACQYYRNVKYCLRKQLVNEKVIKICPCEEKFSIITMLLRHGANVNLKTYKQQTALRTAIERSMCKHVIQILIDNRANINMRDNVGFTPLHYAIRSRTNSQVVRELLAYGADINYKDNDGRTPLHHGILFGVCENIIRILIDNGADVNALTKTNMSPLHTVTECKLRLNNPVCDSYPMYPSENIHVIETCPHQSQICMAIKLLRHGAKIDVKNISGETPLHSAIKKKNCKHVVQVLLNAGADANIVDNENKTPLEVVDFNDSSCNEMIELILIYGANYQLSLNNGNTSADKTLILKIMQYRTMRQMADLPKEIYHDVSNILIGEFRFPKFEKECTEELEKLKSEKLIGKLTARQFLLPNKLQLAYLVSRENAKALLKVISRIDSQSPIYGPLLRKNWAIVEKFAPTFEKAVALLGDVTNPRLPSRPLLTIMSYLNYDDMEMLIQVMNDVSCLTEQMKLLNL